MERKILELTDIKKYYAGSQSVVMGLDGINLSFSRGEFVAITGESGSGKSTLAHVIGGILPYENGEMFFNGGRTSHYDALDWEQYRRDNISFISQNYGILPGASVLRNVTSALLLSGMDKKSAHSAAEDILREVELWEIRRRRAAKLSSGQKQRLSIARALAKPAPILIADEPTGNLDAENSAKIIELLAKVARDRLVLLITHEFSEAEGYATRHIVLRDGNVVSDVPLRPASEPENTPSVLMAEKNKKQKLGLYVAGLQIGSRPIWSFIVGLIFALTAFAVFAFLGVFIINLDDTSTYVYNSKAFENGDMSRIVVSTVDGEPMTDEDYEKLLSVRYVKDLERNDMAVDVRYAYREGIDFETVYQGESNSQAGEYNVTELYRISVNAPFIRTVPLLPGNAEFIRDGRAPQTFFEVVAERGVAKLGDIIDIILCDNKHWGAGVFMKVKMEVVGLTDVGKGLYFSDQVGRMFSNIALSANKDNMYIPDAKVEKGTFICAESAVEKFRQLIENELPPEWTFDVSDPESFGSDTLTLTWSRKYHTVKYMSKLYIVSPEDYDVLAGTENSSQVSVFIDDYAYTDRVLGDIHKLGFVAASPYRLGATTQDETLAAERMQTLEICVTALVVVFALQVLLLIAMFAVQTESFKTLSNIGLTGRTARMSILWQILIFTAIGQAAGALAIFICGYNGVERIEEMLRYLPAVYVILLSAVHIAASALAAIFVLRSIDKHVYPMAWKNRDLVIDEKEDAK